MLWFAVSSLVGVVLTVAASMLRSWWHALLAYKLIASGQAQHFDGFAEYVRADRERKRRRHGRR